MKKYTLGEILKNLESIDGDKNKLEALKKFISNDYPICRLLELKDLKHGIDISKVRLRKSGVSNPRAFYPIFKKYHILISDISEAKKVRFLEGFLEAIHESDQELIMSILRNNEIPYNRVTWRLLEKACKEKGSK